jgi:hypothetical protein
MTTAHATCATRDEDSRCSSAMGDARSPSCLIPAPGRQPFLWVAKEPPFPVPKCPWLSVRDLVNETRGFQPRAARKEALTSDTHRCRRRP